MNSKEKNNEKTIDERVNDLTTQLQLLLAKEIERNKELEAERVERRERDAKYALEQAERDAQHKLILENFKVDLDKSFKKVNKTMSDYGLASGKEAEFNFKLAIKRQKLTCGGIQFDDILPNVQKAREYDLILINGSYVALIEVKRKVSLEDVRKLVTEQAVSFRVDFPQYQDKILVCFLAAYVAMDPVVEKANSLGVGVLLQDGFTIKEVISVLKEF